MFEGEVVVETGFSLTPIWQARMPESRVHKRRPEAEATHRAATAPRTIDSFDLRSIGTPSFQIYAKLGKSLYIGLALTLARTHKSLRGDPTTCPLESFASSTFYKTQNTSSAFHALFARNPQPEVQHSVQLGAVELRDC